MDRIYIEDLKTRCRLGLTEEERRELQEVVVNLVLWADLHRVGRSDRIEDTVDYRAVKKQVLYLVEKSGFKLVETLAQAIADIGLAQPRVRRIRVRVDKPFALRFARSAAVEMTRPQNPMSVAFVGLGSNLQPAENIQAALRSLSRQTQLMKVSTVYISQALDRPEQPPYYNCVAKVMTPAAPLVLKHSVLAYIERELGRVRVADKYAARTIDLDLLSYSDWQVNSPELVLPDPLITQRPFLAVPLAELVPELILPGSHRPLREVAAEFSGRELQALAEYSLNLREELEHETKPEQNEAINQRTACGCG